MNCRISAVVVVPLLAAIVSGCAADSRPKVISTKGDPLIAQRNDEQDGLYRQFRQAAQAAYPQNIDHPPGPDVQRRFMRTGFELINVTCNAYLEGKADRQRTLNVLRDAFAPITTLATGAIAIAHKGETIDSDGLAALAILTSAANSSFEIYEQRYLFGAKNVDNVRRLVLDAQIKHANAALSVEDGNLTYGFAVQYLVQNQMTCSPGSVLDLVSQAIEAGKVTATPKKDDNAKADDGPILAPAAAPAPAPTPTFQPIDIKVG